VMLVWVILVPANFVCKIGQKLNVGMNDCYLDCCAW
jgi:hypothetical protein